MDLEDKMNLRVEVMALKQLPVTVAEYSSESYELYWAFISHSTERTHHYLREFLSVSI